MRLISLLVAVFASLPVLAQEVSAADTPTVDVGGALRFNLLWRSWDEGNRSRVGDVVFDTFRLNADAEWKGLQLSAEYRFYAGYHMLHHGTVGYAFSPAFEVDVGVGRVPFGLLPYASHNWFFGLPYYVGLEDDHDLGARATLLVGPFDVRLAFFKNDEGSYSGASLDSARYSYDVVSATPEALPAAAAPGAYALGEVNQLNARLALPLKFGERDKAEVGLSAQYGGLYDAVSGGFGSHWAGAVHLDLVRGPLNVQLEGLYYAYRPPGALRGAGFVVMGAYDAPYKVAAEAYGLVANVAWTFRIDRGPLDAVTLYNDFSMLAKAGGLPSSIQDTLGARLDAGPIYAYMDLAAGKNHPFLGPEYARALAEGGEDPRWELRPNLNLGWYF